MTKAENTNASPMARAYPGNAARARNQRLRFSLVGGRLADPRDRASGVREIEAQAERADERRAPVQPAKLRDIGEQQRPRGDQRGPHVHLAIEEPRLRRQQSRPAERRDALARDERVIERHEPRVVARDERRHVRARDSALACQCSRLSVPGPRVRRILGVFRRPRLVLRQLAHVASACARRAPRRSRRAPAPSRCARRRLSSGRNPRSGDRNCGSRSRSARACHRARARCRRCGFRPAGRAKVYPPPRPFLE